MAGPGDTVVDINLSRPLPNAFGGADIFGRRTNAGRVIVRYVGMQNGNAAFHRAEITRETNATTMTETPLFLPSSSRTNMSGSVGNIPVSATATTTGYMVVPPRGSQSQAYQGPAFILNAPIGGSLRVEGRTLTILRAEGQNIEYSIQ